MDDVLKSSQVPVRGSEPAVILQVSSLDKAGGAEQIAWNLFKIYRDRGLDSWLAVGKKRTSDSHVVVISKESSRGWWENLCHCLASVLNPLAGKVRGILRLQVALKNLGKGADLFAELRGQENFHFPGSWNLLKYSPRKPAIVHLHNLHGGYFDPRAITDLSSQVPVMLTLHDAWLLSGNCAHSFGCERWKTGCGSCPDISLYPGLKVDSTALNWRRKKAIFANSQLYIATPSRWLMDKVQQSILAPSILESRVIPNGVDTEVFRPEARQHVRSLLGLPLNEPIVLFVANGIKKNTFKDYMTLEEAMKLVGWRSSNKVHFIALGEEGPTEQFGNVQLHYIPRTTNQKEIAQYYQSADLYVHPTKADTFPTTVLEAMACGLPIIASNVGGIPEQIEQGVTGLLINPQDPHTLAQKINLMLENSSLRLNMGEAALQRVQTQFTLELQVNRYLDWYQQIMVK